MPSKSFYSTPLVHSIGDMIRRVLRKFYYQEAGSENWIGMVCQQTSPAAIAEAAIEDAKFVCTRQYGDAPDVTLHGRLDLTFSCEMQSCDGVIGRGVPTYACTTVATFSPAVSAV